MADGYIVGATVRLRARVDFTGTRTPAAVTVEVAGIARADGTPVVLPTTTFSAYADGDYYLRIDTTGMTPGTYNYVVRVFNTDNDVALIEDSFVLAAPLVPLAA